LELFNFSISKIFKPFLSKKKIPSSGIGLYMSKSVINEKFNGVIEAYNTKKGALFIIRLPAM
jgi:signal transduction histidine kinase